MQIPVVGWADLGPWGVITVMVLLIAFGWLIPRWMHKERINDYKNQIALLKQMLDKRDEQLALMMRNNDVAIKVVEEIKREAVK